MAQILLRRDSSTNWTSVNPVLATAELGYDINASDFKIGNGASSWTQLPFFSDKVGSVVGSGFVATSQSSLFQPVASMSNYLNTSQSSVFQQTSAMSNYMQTSQTFSQYLNTSVSSQFALTSNSSLFEQTSHTSIFQLIANSSNSLGTGATSQFINTSVSSQFQLTSNSSLFEQTSHTSVFQLIANSSNSLGTGASASFVLTANASIYEQTSHTSVYQLIANSSNSLGTGASASFMLTANASNYQLVANSSNSLGTGASASFVQTSNSSLFFLTSNSSLNFLTANSSLLVLTANSSLFDLTANTTNYASVNQSIYIGGNTTGTSSSTVAVINDYMNMLGDISGGVSAGSVFVSFADNRNSFFEPRPFALNTSTYANPVTLHTTNSTGSYGIWLTPFQPQDPVYCRHMDFLCTYSFSVFSSTTSLANNTTQTFNHVVPVALYSRQDYGANSTVLTMYTSLVWSLSGACSQVVASTTADNVSTRSFTMVTQQTYSIAFPTTYNNNTSFQYSTFASNNGTGISTAGTINTGSTTNITSVSNTTFFTSAFTALGGTRQMFIPFMQTLQPREYWVGIGMVAQTSNSFAGMSKIAFHCNSQTVMNQGLFFQATNISVNTLGAGSITYNYNNTSNGASSYFPGSFNLNAISTIASNPQLYFNIKGYDL